MYKAYLEYINNLEKTFLFDGWLQLRHESDTKKWDDINYYWIWNGAFYKYYENINKSDIPIAQDAFGDQFFIRDGKMIKLYSEDGEIENINLSFNEWIKKCLINPEARLNIDLKYKLVEWELLLAYPPFCTEEWSNAKITIVPYKEVIDFHIDFYNQIKQIPNKSKIQIKVID